MIHWDETPPKDDLQKWSEWSMRPPKAAKKTTRQVNNLASAFVLMLSAIVVSGLPHQFLV